MADFHMPIGYDIDLLCEAVTVAVLGPGRHSGAAPRFHVSQRYLQRYVRVGFVKTQRLLLLMDDYGITSGQPHSRRESRTLLIGADQLPAKLAELRQIASREVARA